MKLQCNNCGNWDDHAPDFVELTPEIISWLSFDAWEEIEALRAIVQEFTKLGHTAPGKCKIPVAIPAKVHRLILELVHRHEKDPAKNWGKFCEGGISLGEQFTSEKGGGGL